jgi:ABC-type sugar transport system ATPase subunit
MAELLVEMTGISKSFPGVHALDEASFELRAGEVHALVGENGAGKSTLMKILAGIYHRDAGTIKFKGGEVEIPSPRAAQDLGISIIHQELNLMGHLTVAQNIFIGREPRGAARTTSPRRTSSGRARGPTSAPRTSRARTSAPAPTSARSTGAAEPSPLRGWPA